MNRKRVEIEKLEVMQHNRKVRVKNMQNQVKVNNYFSMNNQERFKNVCLGYSIQAERLLKKLQEYTDGNITKEWVSEERKSAVEHISSLMRKIQIELIKLEDMQKKYSRHIHNSIYCKSAMKPYVKQLEKIIAETDALVKGAADERKH